MFAKGGNAHLYAILLPSLAQRTRVLPLWPDMARAHIDLVLDAITAALA
jgi:dTDP-4-amino-4,6-dideoxygalactose transaminase